MQGLRRVGSKDCVPGNAFVTLLLQLYEEELINLLKQPDQGASYGFNFSFVELAGADVELAELLLTHPQQTVQVLDAALVEAQERMLQRNHQEQMTLKPFARVRPSSLPYYLDESNAGYLPSIGQIRSMHVHQMVSVSGRVVRTGAMKMLESERTYECQSCRHRFTVVPDLEAGATLQAPRACPAAGESSCRGAKFRHVEELGKLTDYQEIRVQEHSQCLAMGAMARSIPILLMHELADRVQVGEEVEVTGTVLRQWRPVFPGVRCEVELAVLAHGLAVTGGRPTAPGQGADLPTARIDGFRRFWAMHRAAPLAGRNAILRAMCPQIHGLFAVKLALVLMLVGGLRREGEGGSTTRGEIHVLLVGDPGTGKSQCLKAAAQLSPRAVVTTGLGSSAAGLTVAAVREGGAWALEAGALVLADGGLACIDEFDGLRESERAAIHEAMEQQSVSVAKAGLVARLPTRCAVLGVANPKGAYDPRQSLTANTTLAAPLLSRFDVILLLRDARLPAWDQVVADHVLDLHARGGRVATPASARDPIDEAGALQCRAWGLEHLKQYIAWVRCEFWPAVGPKAEDMLRGYFCAQRAAEGRSAARTTVRMLESLTRLAQAHARLMARSIVMRQDVVVAISLVEASMHTQAVADAQDALHSLFPDDPDADYLQQESAVLAQIAGAGNNDGCTL